MNKDGETAIYVRIDKRLKARLDQWLLAESYRVGRRLSMKVVMEQALEKFVFSKG